MSRPSSPSQPSFLNDKDGSLWIRVPSDAISESGTSLSVTGSTNGTAHSANSDVRWTGSDDEASDPEIFGLQQWVSLMWRRRLIIFGTVAILVLAALFYVVKTIPVYEATASILVPTPNQGVTADSLTQQIPMLEDLMDSTRPRAVDTEVAILNDSSGIQNGAIQRLNSKERAAVVAFGRSSIPNDPNLDWKALLTVSEAEKTDILNLATRTYNADASRALAQAICDEYIKHSQDDTQNQVRQAADYVGGQLQKVRLQVDDAAQNLENWKKKNNSIDLSVESENKLDTLKEIQTDLQQNDSEQVANVAKLNRLQQIRTTLAPTEIEESDIVVRPVVQDLESQLTKLQMDLLAEQQTHTDAHPHVIALKEQIQSIQHRLRSEAHTEVGGVKQNINPIQQQIDQNIADLKAEIEAGRTRSGAIKTALDAAQASLATLPQKEYQLGKLNADLNAFKDTYQMLNEKYQTLLIGEQGKLTNAQIIAPPMLPLRPIWPKKGLLLSSSVILGLLLGVAFAFIIERLDDRVHSEADVIRSTRLPVLAHIPYLQDRNKQVLITSSDKTSALLESYRMLRTNIGFMALDEPFRSIVVTSSQPNEGKSMTSVNLAVAMVLAGKRVILLDCDLRRPSLHKLFDLPNIVGFTSLVAGLSSLEAALQPTSIPNLQLLTSGPIPPNPPELIDSRVGRACLQQIFDAADIVIIDSPPALMLADAQMISSLADASLLVVSANEASKRQIERTSSLVSKSGRLLGIVLNKMKASIDGYYGDYNYKVYGAYLKAEDGDGANTLSQIQSNGSHPSERN